MALRSDHGIARRGGLPICHHRRDRREARACMSTTGSSRLAVPRCTADLFNRRVKDFFLENAKPWGAFPLKWSTTVRSQPWPAQWPSDRMPSWASRWVRARRLVMSPRKATSHPGSMSSPSLRLITIRGGRSMNGLAIPVRCPFSAGSRPVVGGGRNRNGAWAGFARKAQTSAELDGTAVPGRARSTETIGVYLGYGLAHYADFYDSRTCSSLAES